MLAYDRHVRKERLSFPVETIQLGRERGCYRPGNQSSSIPMSGPSKGVVAHLHAGGADRHLILRMTLTLTLTLIDVRCCCRERD